jgi:hypothetical protein
VFVRLRFLAFLAQYSYRAATSGRDHKVVMDAVIANNQAAHVKWPELLTMRNGVDYT